MTRDQFGKLPPDEAWNFAENAHAQRDDALARIDTMDVERANLLAAHAAELATKDSEWEAKYSALGADAADKFALLADKYASQLAARDAELKAAREESAALAKRVEELQPFDADYQAAKKQREVDDLISQGKGIIAALADRGVKVDAKRVE